MFLRRIRPRPRTLIFLLLVALCATVGSVMARNVVPSIAAEDEQTATIPAAPTTLQAAALPVTGHNQDYDPLMEMIGDAQFVLLGEATHGTHEFYRERARITRRLIEEKGFNAVAIEADWEETRRIHHYIHGRSGDTSAEQALSGFTDFPEWMWRNTDVRDLVEWLRTYNDTLPNSRSGIGFYGLDLQKPFESIDPVVRYLERVDTEAANRARERYGCFANFSKDPIAYGREAAPRGEGACADEALAQLQEMEQRVITSTLYHNPVMTDELFSAIQNARVVKNGEEYFRSPLLGNTSSWNLRDHHMADALDALATQSVPGQTVKVVAWAHNSHMGDASATEMGEYGEWNVGQLMRERHKDGAVLVGFTTYSGTVVAASNWGAPGVDQPIRPALPDSYSGLFHSLGVGNFLLLLRGKVDLVEPRLERAIGVIYLPQSERASHYFEADLMKQFDAVIHMDVTRAVAPLQP